MLRKLTFLIVVLLFLSSFVDAAYYATVVVDVTSDGLVEISGTSNHPLLKEGVYDNLTSKENGYWVLNVSTLDVFELYNYEINLPDNTRVNYMGVYGVDVLEADNGFQIAGSVEDKPFKLLIQYKQDITQSDYVMFFGFTSIVIVFGVGIYLYFAKQGLKKVYDKDKFSEREFMIIQLLQKNKGCLTQARLEKLTGLPKASLHRNVSSLERKEIIEKAKIGMTNKICLK